MCANHDQVDISLPRVFDDFYKGRSNANFANDWLPVIGSFKNTQCDAEAEPIIEWGSTMVC